MTDAALGFGVVGLISFAFFEIFVFFCLMQLGLQNAQLQHQQQQLLPSVGFKIFFWKRLDFG
jgi:hypothetical protein